MLKNISNLGKALSRDEQKMISGGLRDTATLQCQNGTVHTVAFCNDTVIDAYCGTNGGLKICVG